MHDRHRTILVHLSISDAHNINVLLSHHPQSLFFPTRNCTYNVTNREHLYTSERQLWMKKKENESRLSPQERKLRTRGPCQLIYYTRDMALQQRLQYMYSSIIREISLCARMYTRTTRIWRGHLAALSGRVGCFIFLSLYTLDKWELSLFVTGVEVSVCLHVVYIYLCSLRLAKIYFYDFKKQIKLS